MQKPKGTWTKVAAVTAVVCVLLGIGYALICTYFHSAGYYFEQSDESHWYKPMPKSPPAVYPKSR